MHQFPKKIDPFKFIKMCWPKVVLYDKQRAILRSVFNNDETVVPAGNMLGKDFIAALIALTFFMTRHPCRVVTTSVDQGQLENVLWGEINNFIDTSRYELPLKVNYCEIHKIVKGKIDKKSYLIGRVAAKEEGLLGHHLARGENNSPHTLMIYDEASGIMDGFKGKTDTWAHRTLIIGNPYPCENFFKEAVRNGPVATDDGTRKYVEVIRIRAEDSPNVRLAQVQIALGEKPTNEVIIPGVLGFEEYVKRRKLWDPMKQCISLDADFYEGAETKMYPSEWLNRCEKVYQNLHGKKRQAQVIGVDVAEGGDSSVWTVLDHFGIIEQKSIKTPDTNVIPGITLELMARYGVDAKDVWFDRGGGGKQHVDRLRSMGHKVRSVAFGEPATDPLQNKPKSMSRRVDANEVQYVYKNKRAEMYGLLRLRMDPVEEVGFAIPHYLTELRRQLSLMPLDYDKEGRLYLPPKKKPNPKSKEVSLIDIIKRSPDESDSLVIACYGLKIKKKRHIIGGFAA